MNLLGIETSCDETAAAVVQDGQKLLSSVVASSMDLHAQYGGVVPEIAAREHVAAMIPAIEQALLQAFPEHQASDLKTKGLNDAMLENAWDNIDAIAVTYGAGLGGSLLIGVLTARTLAIIKNKPLYAVNHVAGHLYANFLIEGTPTTSRHHSAGKVHPTPATAIGSHPIADYTFQGRQPEFPMLGLIVSGGHSQLVLYKNHFDYQLLGQTQDDAIGEAFDKVAKILGLPYPGGVSVSMLAPEGNPLAYKLPKARLPGKYDFSFSGLKTAVLRLAQQLVGEDYSFPSSQIAARLRQPQKADIAASFQHIAVETIVDKAVEACREYKPRSFIIGGGVAASAELRRQLSNRLPLEVQYPDMKLCTDNAAMIATLGYYQASLGQPLANPYSLDIAPSLSM
jgi:N6-L-threonylcarbamoyladenine synthase